MDRQVRRSMVEHNRADLSVVRQCQLLSISRSSFYAMPRGESDINLAIMAEIDRQFLDTPFYGVRQMTPCFRTDLKECPFPHIGEQRTLPELPDHLEMAPCGQSEDSGHRLYKQIQYPHLKYAKVLRR